MCSNSVNSQTPGTLRGLQEKVAEDLFKRNPTEARNSGICVSCGEKVYYSPAPKAEKKGHIYSVAGQNEYRITSLCEFCFDSAFNDVPEDDTNTDQWKEE